MKYVVLALLLASPSAVASKRHRKKHSTVPSQKRCGAMEDADSVDCVAAQLERGRAAIVTITCADGSEVDVRIWLGEDGDVHFFPRTASAACGDSDL